MKKWTKRRDALRDKDAWRFATAWKKELFGYVIPTWRSFNSKSVIHNYEWIEFDLTTGGDGDPGSLRQLEKRWFAAQAASVIWTLLSCCRGFSGHENPDFWKQVFKEYVRKKGAHVTINDAFRFFVNDPFPRFRLRVAEGIALESLGARFRGFLEYRGPLITGKVNALAPFCLPSRLKRSIEVCIIACSNTFDNVRAISAVLAVLRESPWAQSLSTPAIAQWLPPFEVTQVDVSSISINTDADVDGLIEFLHHAPPCAAELTFSTTYGTPRAVFARCLLAVANARPPYYQCEVCRASFSLGWAIDERIGAIFSILPLSRFLTTLEVSVNTGYASLSSDLLWYWIEYANFHPDVATTSWQSLKIDGSIVSPRSIEQLSDLDHRQCSALRERVTIRTGSIVYENASVDSASLICLERETQLDVYHWTLGGDPQSGWVNVVVPGFGDGWVADATILITDLKPVEQSQLRTLSWRQTLGYSDIQHSVLRSVLKRYGQRLRLLQVELWVNTESSDVYAILDATPVLVSLSLRVFGTIQLHVVNRDRPYPLCELVVDSRDMCPCQAVLNGPFPNISALAASISPPEGENVPFERFLELLKHNSRLQYLRIFPTYGVDSEYMATHHRSWSALSIGSGKNNSAEVSFRHECKLAFLSVLKRFAQLATIDDRWEEAIVRQIFAFATSNIEREVYVSTKFLSKDIYDSRRRSSVWKQLFG